MSEVDDRVVFEDEEAAVAGNEEAATRDRCPQRSPPRVDTGDRHVPQEDAPALERLEKRPRGKLETTAVAHEHRTASEGDRGRQQPRSRPAPAEDAWWQHSRQRRQRMQPNGEIDCV